MKRGGELQRVEEGGPQEVAMPVSSDFEVMPESSAEHPREGEQWGGRGAWLDARRMEKLCGHGSGQVGPGSRSKLCQDWEPG